MLLCICPYAEKEWDSENEEWVDLTQPVCEYTKLGTNITRTPPIIIGPNKEEAQTKTKTTPKKETQQEVKMGPVHIVCLYTMRIQVH